MTEVKERLKILIALDKFMVAEIRDSIVKAIDGKKSISKAAHDCSDNIIKKLKEVL